MLHHCTNTDALVQESDQNDNASHQDTVIEGESTTTIKLWKRGSNKVQLKVLLQQRIYRINMSAINLSYIFDLPVSHDKQKQGWAIWQKYHIMIFFRLPILSQFFFMLVLKG